MMADELPTATADTAPAADIPRVKRNVAKMIDQGAPEADIDAYLSGERVTADQLRAAPKKVEPSTTPETLIKQGLVGLGKGTIQTIMTPLTPFASAAEGIRAGGTKIAKAMGAEVPTALEQPIPAPAEIVQRAIEPMTGEFRKPENMPERFAERIGEFAAGGLVSPGSIGRRVLGSVVAPAVGSQAAAELPGVHGTKYEAIASLLGAAGGLGAAGAGRAIMAPVTSNIRARMDPAGYARSQVARMLDDSRMPGTAVADEVAAAAGEGQPMFTVADAMGNAGQRGLSTVARAPGQGRTDVVNFLEGRQGGQGGRVANALAEGFNAPQTARQMTERLTEARDTAANAAYGAVRRDAGAVDLTNTVARIDDTLGHGFVRRGTNLADDSIESVLSNVRNRLTDDRSMLTDFTAVQRARADLADRVEKARRAGEGNKARMLGQVLREMDTAMENASAGHRAANRQYSEQSRAIDAIEEGRTAAQRGRSEDTTREFAGRPQEQQQPFRTGYVDPLIEQTQGAAFGANKARPFTSDAFGAEAGAMAPGAEMMGRRLGRENTMFETRRQATGGSQTADNLADAGAAGLDPTLIANAIMSPRSAVRQVLTAGSNVLSGNTPTVREEIARLLMMRGQTATPQHIRETLNELRRAEVARQLSKHLGTGLPAAIAGQMMGAP